MPMPQGKEKRRWESSLPSLSLHRPFVKTSKRKSVWPEKPVTLGDNKRIRISDDVDFASDDYDGRIKRCMERLEAGYAVEAFDSKLQDLTQARDKHRKRLEKYPAMGQQEIDRFLSLKRISKHLKKIGDPCKELRNVKAVMAAYESGKLKWNYLATYWCQGKMIEGPSRFLWKDFRRLNNAENRGGEGFWVEGVFPLNGRQNVYKYRHCASDTSDESGFPEAKVLVRLDSNVGNPADQKGNPYPELELRCLDDSAASMFTIYKNDMLQLMGSDAESFDAPPDHLMGYEEFIMANGAKDYTKVVAIEVNMNGINEKGEPALMLEEWSAIPCSVYETNEGDNDGAVVRLVGPWLRCVFYVGSSPEKPLRLYTSTTRDGLTEGDEMMPIIPLSDRKLPEFERPEHAIAWMYRFASSSWVSPPDRSRAGKLPTDPR